MGNDIFGDAVIALGIFIAVEEYYGIQFMDTEVQDIKTIDELVELVKLKQLK